MEEDLYEQDERKGERIIAEKELNLAVKNHYEVGYQGALIGQLEEREEKTALNIIKEFVEREKGQWKDQARVEAQEQLTRFLASKVQQ
jgi:hypothetical protein